MLFSMVSAYSSTAATSRSPHEFTGMHNSVHTLQSPKSRAPPNIVSSASHTLSWLQLMEAFSMSCSSPPPTTMKHTTVNTRDVTLRTRSELMMKAPLRSVVRLNSRKRRRDRTTTSHYSDTCSAEMSLTQPCLSPL